MRSLYVIVSIATVLFSGSLGAQEIVTITKATTAQILVDNNKVIGSARLSAGQDYQLIGLVNQQYLLQQGTLRYLVDPHATNYEDLYLLKPLGLNHQTPPNTAAELADSNYVPDVSIYPTGTANSVASQTIPANIPSQDSVPNETPPQTVIEETTYVPNYSSAYYYPANYYGFGVNYFPYQHLYYPPITIHPSNCPPYPYVNSGYVVGGYGYPLNNYCRFGNPGVVIRARF